MKTYRFVTEYANYIKGRVRQSDLPSSRKNGYINDIELIVTRCHQGMVTLNETMSLLSNAEAWINGVM